MTACLERFEPGKPLKTYESGVLALFRPIQLRQMGLQGPQPSMTVARA